MPVETAIILAGVGVLKKPMEDLLAAGGKGIRGYFRQWQASINLDAVAQRIEQVGLITTIASRQASTVDDIYYAAHLKQGKGVRTINSADEFFSERIRLAVIHGTAGQGKSVFLRYLCLHDLRQGKKIPLFIELRKIDSDNDLLVLISKHVISLGFNENLIEAVIGNMLNTGKIRIYLDGFDEVKREYALSVRDNIQMLLNKNQKLEVVLSSRPGALSQYLIDIGRLQQYEIAPLTDKDYAGFFDKIGVQLETKDRLLVAIHRSNAQIKRLLSTPLMLTLLVLTCGMHQDLPDTLPEFYDSLFNLLSSMHDGTKPGYVRQKATSLGNLELEALFRAFSFSSKELFDRISLNPIQFEQSFQSAIKLTEARCTSDGFRADVTETVCLMVKEGMDSTFVHKSIQEYYAASFIHRIQDDSLALKVLESIENNYLYSWLNELRFLEDFQNLSYEKCIGIPHAEVFTESLCMKGRKHPAVSKIKLRAMIVSLGIQVSRGKVSKRITGIYWRPDSNKVAPNRYFSDLVQAISKDLLSLGKQGSFQSGLNDQLVFVSLSTIFAEEPAVSEKLHASAQRVIDRTSSSGLRMKERSERKGKSLLDLMKAGSKDLAQ